MSPVQACIVALFLVGVMLSCVRLEVLSAAQVSGLLILVFTNVASMVSDSLVRRRSDDVPCKGCPTALPTPANPVRSAADSPSDR